MITGVRQSRRGVTLIELLIIMAIISLLAALTAGAVFRAKESQEKVFTETTLRKLASALDVQWKAVIDAAKKEYDGLPNEIKQNLLVLADNTLTNPPRPHPRRDDRARLLYIKFRLKQEFPVSFTDVANPGYMKIGTVDTYYLKPNNGLTGKSAYIKAISIGSPGVDKESSALLVLSLEQPRSGMAGASVDQLVGSTFLRTEKGSRYLTDAWGNPLQFFVFPTTTGPSTTDLDGGKDAQDPEGLLTPGSSGWTPPTMIGPTTMPPLYFNTLLHPLVLYRRLVPVIASVGPDGLLGGPFAAIDPSMNLQTADAFDNIYSYRLRQTGARGD